MSKFQKTLRVITLLALCAAVPAQAKILKNSTYRNPFDVLETCKTNITTSTDEELLKRIEGRHTFDYKPVNADGRIYAICQLGARKVPAAYNAIVQHMSYDPFGDVRAMAAVAAANYKKYALVETLLDRLYLEEDSDRYIEFGPQVSIILGWALGTLAKNKDVPEIVRRMNFDNDDGKEREEGWESRQGAALAVGILADRGVIKEKERVHAGKVFQERLLKEMKLGTYWTLIDAIGSLRYKPATEVLGQILMGEVKPNIKFYTAEDHHFPVLTAYEEFADPMTIAPTKKWAEKIAKKIPGFWDVNYQSSINSPICSALKAAKDPNPPELCKRLYGM